MVYCRRTWRTATLKYARRNPEWVILVQPIVLKLCSRTVEFSVFTTRHGVNENREVDPIMILFLWAELMLWGYGGSRNVSSLKILPKPVVNVIELGVHALDVAFDLTAIAPNV